MWAFLIFEMLKMKKYLLNSKILLIFALENQTNY